MGFKLNNVNDRGPRSAKRLLMQGACTSMQNRRQKSGFPPITISIVT